MASRCASREDRCSVSDSSRVWESSVAASVEEAAAADEAADADAPRPAVELGLFLRRLLAPALPDADPAADADADALCLRAAARLRLPPRRLDFPTWMFSCGCALWLAEFDDLPPPKDRGRLPPPPEVVVLDILVSLPHCLLCCCQTNYRYHHASCFAASCFEMRSGRREPGRRAVAIARRPAFAPVDRLLIC